MLVVTVNSQAGMSNSVSLGVVAAVDRETGCTPSPALQISGTIGPGASGGAVLDTEGRAVGITFAMFSPTTSAAPFNMPKIFITPSDSDGSPTDMAFLSEFLKMFQDYGLMLKGDSNVSDADRAKHVKEAERQMLAARDMLNNMVDVSRTTGSSGFAIPINRIKPIIDQLKSGKTIQHAALGMRLEMTDEGIRMVPSTGSPADKAGVQTGDILVSINGRKFQTVSAITTYITNLRKGDRVNLVVRRNGKEIPITVTAVSREDMTDIWLKYNEMQPPGSKAWPIRKPFSLSLDDADVTTVAKALSQAADVDVVAVSPEKIKGKVTVHMKSTYLETALPLICEALGCKFAKSGSGYILSPIK
jgi:hypothetical protein